MKKQLLLMAALAVSALGFAQEETTETITKTYEDSLSVTVDGEGTQMTASVNVEYLAEGSAINLTLKNFILVSGNNTLPVGNIEISDVALTSVEGVSYKTFTFNDKATITAGDDDVIDEDDTWLGPLLFYGGLDVDMAGKITDEKLYLTIDIDFTMAGVTQKINVVFGSDFTNAIHSVKADALAQDGRIYDLTGAQVTTVTRPGIYIVNGKKVVIK